MMRFIQLVLALSILLLCSLPAEAQILKKLKRAVDDVVVTPSERRESCEYATLSKTSGVIFSESFESGKLGSMWARRPSEHSLLDVVDRIQDVERVPYEGDYALAMGVQNSVRTRELVTNAVDLCLDLSAQKDVVLQFMARDHMDQNTPEDAILLSDNGGEDFKVALRLEPFGWSDKTYGMITVDIAKAADQLNLVLNNQFVIRFRQSGTQDFAGNHDHTTDGLIIDDLILKGSPLYARVPLRDGFESGQLSDHWRISDPFRAGETAPELYAQWGFVQPVQRLSDVPPIPRTGDYSLAIGRPMGKGRGYHHGLVTAADLHLNLDNKEEASLRCFLRHEFDEPGEYDGIYLSDDGGEHFFKALNFPTTRDNAKTYTEIKLDLAKSASELGISLTDEFVIRFQQHGTHDFSGIHAHLVDGLFIDDLVVDAPLSPIEQILAKVKSEISVWRQQGRYETTKDYETRMSAGDEAIRDSLTQQAVRSLASTLIDFSTVTSAYDPDTEMFTLTVHDLLPFKVPVPISEAEAFDLNLSTIEVRNAVYALGDEDVLILVSADITNPGNGKSYTIQRSQTP